MSQSDLGPRPSLDEWQEQVRAAMAETDESKPRLRWTLRDDAIRWDLNGDCPRCRDYTSKLVSGVVVSDAAFEAGDLIELMMSCACEIEHVKGRSGCGAGEGMYIRVPAPTRL